MTFHTYQTSFNDSPEVHQNKRDAIRAAKSEAKRTGEAVKVTTLTHSGARYDESAVVIRREAVLVTP